MSELVDEDGDTLERLARLARLNDPVPADVVAAAKASYTFRTLDSELAELVYDSAMEAAQLVGVRGGGARQLTFEAPGLAVETEIAADGRLVGQMVPPQAARVEIRHRGGSTVVQADELGRFHADGLEAGPMSLRCWVTGTAGVPPTETDWIVI